MIDNNAADLKLFLVRPREDYERSSHYDVFTGVVVAAINEIVARGLHPCGYVRWSADLDCWMDVGLPHNLPRRYDYGEEDWVANPEQDLEVTHIGNAVTGTVTGIIQSSYNAG
tara:strand:- start:533 stop:871 length:339 start_codon:yes stop_codon:yes gene_type:complete